MEVQDRRGRRACTELDTSDVALLCSIADCNISFNYCSLVQHRTDERLWSCKWLCYRAMQFGRMFLKCSLSRLRQKRTPSINYFFSHIIVTKFWKLLQCILLTFVDGLLAHEHHFWWPDMYSGTKHSVKHGRKLWWKNGLIPHPTLSCTSNEAFYHCGRWPHNSSLSCIMNATRKGEV